MASDSAKRRGIRARSTSGSVHGTTPFRFQVAKFHGRTFFLTKSWSHLFTPCRLNVSPTFPACQGETGVRDGCTPSDGSTQSTGRNGNGNGNGHGHGHGTLLWAVLGGWVIFVLTDGYVLQASWARLLPPSGGGSNFF